MFNPIGPQNATVYWRRRIAVIGSIVLVVVLIVLTVNAMRSDGASTTASKTQAAAAKPPASSSSAVAPPAASSTSASTGSSSSSDSAKKSPSSSTSSSVPVTGCVTKNLLIRAVVGKSSYKVGDTPLLQLQVTNTGATPCTQNLADSQVEMRVYNGESRVWGSHDCKIMPGSNVRTLNPKVPVLVSIQWSGLSSQPKCAGTRQRVNAGTYTLYTALAGRTGTATQFSIG